MSATKQCRSCGTNVPENAPFGHCPACLLKLGFGPLPDDTEPAPAATDATRRFGDYELIEQLGRGGMGVIYKARQLRLNRLVAIKMISVGEFASPMLVHRFHREAEAAANLNHPNIVPIYETGEMRGQHFYSMQLIDGHGLDRDIGGMGFRRAGDQADAKSALRSREEDVARIVAQIARAVDYAHQHGVLHRDLKPSNILLDSKGEPHLTDFGVAKVIGHDSNLTASGAIMGTPSYMAPEQAAGDSKRITTAGDIYSLGAVLYTMLTGSPPFRAETPVETLRQVVEQEPRHPSTLREGIDADLATIAMKCLEKESSRRYATAALLADDLERWMRGEPILARPVQTSERFWRWCRRNPKAAVLTGSIALLLLALSVGSTVVALYITRINSQLHVSNGELNNQVLRGLQEIYANPYSTNYTIEASTRRSLKRQELKTPGGVPLKLTLVDFNYLDPRTVLDVFSAILLKLEKELQSELQRPVDIDLLVVQSYDRGYNFILTNHLAFGRVGPSSFIQLKDSETGVQLLAMQDHRNPLTMALFTRNDNPLVRIWEQMDEKSLARLLTNRTLAFGSSNSTTGSWVPRDYLADRGVYSNTLAYFIFAGSHGKVIAAVTTNRTVDCGFVNAELLRAVPGVQIIDSFVVSTNLGRCWVAGPTMDPKLFSMLQTKVLALKDQAIIGNIESELDGFKLVSDSAFEELRQMMRGAHAFTSGPQKP